MRDFAGRCIYFVGVSPCRMYPFCRGIPGRCHVGNYISGHRGRDTSSRVSQ
nr:MAG TPA: hypothetical protein [Caudoviricetes sp.]